MTTPRCAPPADSKAAIRAAKLSPAEWTHLLMLIASDMWAGYVFHDALDSSGNRLHLRVSAAPGCLYEQDTHRGRVLCMSEMCHISPHVVCHSLFAVMTYIVR